MAALIFIKIIRICVVSSYQRVKRRVICAEKHKKYTQVSFIIQVYLKSLEGMLSRSANVSRLRSIVLSVSDKFVAASCSQLNWKN